jgi:uncharacterized protein (DUF58 family)
VAGDDVRHINWNVFARTGQPVVRTFRAETSAPLWVLVDASASMGVGAPSKLQFAWRLAVAFAFSAFAARDEVRLFVARATLSTIAASQRTPQEQAESLAELQPFGPTNMAAVAAELKQHHKKHEAQLVWISDFFDARGVEPALLALGRPRLMPVFVQVEAPEDVDPAASLGKKKAVVLRDAETARHLAVTTHASVLENYHSRRRVYNEAFARLCQARGVRLLRVRSDASFVAAALKLLRQSGCAT